MEALIIFSFYHLYNACKLCVCKGFGIILSCFYHITDVPTKDLGKERGNKYCKLLFRFFLSGREQKQFHGVTMLQQCDSGSSSSGTHQRACHRGFLASGPHFGPLLHVSASCGGAGAFCRSQPLSWPGPSPPPPLQAGDSASPAGPPHLTIWVLLHPSTAREQDTVHKASHPQICVASK